MYGELGSTGLTRGRKKSPSEGGLRIPYIVRWPGHVPAGRVDATSVISNADWLPTISAIVGAPLLSARTSAPLDLDGVDVSSHWLGVRHAGHARCAPLFWTTQDKDKADYGGHMMPMCVLRDGPHKVFLRCGNAHHDDQCAVAKAARPRESMTVYDISADPGEVAPLPHTNDAVGAARMRWLQAMTVAYACRRKDGRWRGGALPPPKAAHHHHCAKGWLDVKLSSRGTSDVYAGSVKAARARSRSGSGRAARAERA